MMRTLFPDGARCVRSALSFLLMIGIAMELAAHARAFPYMMPDYELLNESEFVKEWGGGSLISRSDVPGPGVEFVILLGSTGDGKTGYGDYWPPAYTANFGWDPVLRHYTSLAGYDSIRMNVRYASGPAGSDVSMQLFMNTGLTGPSGFPSNDRRNNTFWGGAWTNIAVGEMTTIVLDFDNAQPQPSELLDNPEPHTQAPIGYQSGDYVTINLRDRYEVSHFGFQIADFDFDLARGEQVVLELNVVPEPASLALLLLGLTALVRRRL